VHTRVDITDGTRGYISHSGEAFTLAGNYDEKAVVWSSEGADDFRAALAYLRNRNVAAAERLMHAVNAALQRLDELPIDGPESELSSGALVRSWPIPPFRVYYQRRDDDVLIVRLYDQRREPIERD
jgi:plasmid stabilization system protein ParE